MSSLRISSKGTFFLTIDDDVSPAWLIANGWAKSTVIAGSWYLTATVNRWKTLSDYMGDSLELDVTVYEWLMSNGLAREDIVNIDLSRLDARLFPHQREAVAWLVKRRSALVAPAPGLGKSAISLQAALLSDSKGILIVCPFTLMRNWVREAQMWMPEADVRRWHGSEVERYGQKTGLRITIVNYDTITELVDSQAVRKSLQEKYDTLIIDESILIKNSRAVRAKAMAKLRPLFTYAWELSGGPVSRYYDDMYMQLHVLEPTVFSKYWKFAAQYCELHQSRWGTSVIANKFGADVQLRRSLAQWYYPLSYADSGMNIPEWVFSDIEVPLGDKQYEMYKQMEESFLVDIVDEPLERVLAPNVLAKMIRMNQLVSNPALLGGPDISAKTDAVIEQMEFMPGPFIVWTAFIDTASRLATALSGKGMKVAVLTGSTDADARQRIVDAFQRGDLEVLIAHPTVGKYGLTLTKARTAIYMERTWNGDDYFQSLYRLRRIGTTEPPQVVHLLATGPNGEPTVDSVIQDVLNYRQRATHSLTRRLVLDSLSSKARNQDEMGHREPQRRDRSDHALEQRHERPSTERDGKGRNDGALVLSFDRNGDRGNCDVRPDPTPRPIVLPKPGFYTVLLEDGDYVTIQVKEWPDHTGNEHGRIVLRYLHGAENSDESNYRAFASWSETYRSPRLWKAFRSEGRLASALERLAQTDDYGQLGYQFALMSNCCYKCGRMLTVPASIHRGMGPTCAAGA